MNTQTIGDFMLSLKENKNTLHMKFSSHDILNSWSKCSLTSNFSSSYLTFTNCSKENESISNSLSFIINELLENAVKNSPQKRDEDMIDLTLIDKGKEIILEIDNLMNRKNYLILKKIAEDLQDATSTEEKFRKAMQEIAQNIKQSGMGLLMIINFFKIKMGFKFSGPEKKGYFHASIQARLNKEALLQ